MSSEANETCTDCDGACRVCVYLAAHLNAADTCAGVVARDAASYPVSFIRR